MPKPKPPAPLHVLFAGESLRVTLIDQSTCTIFVRALPARHLGLVIAHCDQPSDLVELCCYLTTDESCACPAFPQVAPPTGFFPVMRGWSDNLSPATVKQLYAIIQTLNFTAAAAWSEDQVTAKAWQGPLLLKADQVLMPIVERMVGLLSSALTARASSASPESKS